MTTRLAYGHRTYGWGRKVTIFGMLTPKGGGCRIAGHRKKREGNYIPCDQIRLNSVHLGKVQPGLLKEAWKKIGATIRYGVWYLNGVEYTVTKEGKLRGRVDQDTLASVRNKLAIAYSKLALGKAARTFGWAVTPVAGQVNEYVMRRG